MIKEVIVLLCSLFFIYQCSAPVVYSTSDSSSVQPVPPPEMEEDKDSVIVIHLLQFLQTEESKVIDISDTENGNIPSIALQLIGNNNKKTPLLVNFQNFASGKGTIKANGKSILKETIPVIDTLATQLQFPTYTNIPPKQVYIHLHLTKYEQERTTTVERKLVFLLR